LAERLKAKENRSQFAVARLAGAFYGVDYQQFLPHPPPPKFISVDQAADMLAGWVKQAGGTIQGQKNGMANGD
jgi:hypothetical protein